MASSDTGSNLSRGGRAARPAPRWARWALTGVAVATVALTGCATVDGRAVSSLYNPERVGGLPVTQGPSGLRPDAPAPHGFVRNTDDGAMDRLALQGVDDVEQFWSEHYDPSWDGPFDPITNLMSYDSTDPFGPRVCGLDPYGVPNAFYCNRDRLMAWDRGQLLPVGEKFFGQMAIAALIAHEYGHAIQRMAELVGRSTPVIVFEQQADCLAGTYVAWVAAGSSPRFEMSTGDGLNKVLAAAITLRDPILTPEDTDLVEEGHGTALDRVSAFQMGFINGASACAAIDLDEIETRRGDLPLVLQTDDATGALQTGEAPIDEALVETLIEVLNTQFAPTQPPTLAMEAQPCPDAQTTTPAGYCPATNTITVDLPALRELGTPADEEQNVLIQGDNTALSVVTSRYVLALQHQRGVPLDSAAAALRTACLTGIAQRSMVEPVALPSGKSLILTAGDLDEAVAGLLNNGLAASDVNANTVPAGFTRIMAFRSGLQSEVDDCFSRFP